MNQFVNLLFEMFFFNWYRGNEMYLIIFVILMVFVIVFLFGVLNVNVWCMCIFIFFIGVFKVSGIIEINEIKRKIVILFDGNVIVDVKLWGELVFLRIFSGFVVEIFCVYVDLYQGRRLLNLFVSIKVKVILVIFIDDVELYLIDDNV